jgi:putative ABC transport system ATP-binding protein
MPILPFFKNAEQKEDASPWMIDLRGVHKYYQSAAGDYHALKGIDLQINPGEFVSIIGKSGSGKSTLLNMISGIDRPTEGEAWINNTAVHEMNENQMAIWRGTNPGIIFQFFQLLPSWPACLPRSSIISSTGLP